MAIPTNTTVTIRTRSDGAPDDYGIPTPVWTNTGSAAAFLEQTDAVEVTEGADVAVSDWKLYLNGAPTLKHRDRVVEGGRTFEVVGSPWPAKWPGGIVSHTEARLRLVA